MSFNNSSTNDLQPRAPRKRKRSSSERGLASDADLASLARAYLDAQHRLWPALAKQGVLPAKTDEAIRQMVEQYKQCHRSREVDTNAVTNRYKHLRLKVASAYARYSCDNSSPTSIEDQMANCLRKAHDEGRFIPWEYVFTDYSVSGLDSTRRGYMNCKSVITDPTGLVDTVYIDDFTRASRDSLEWWKLAQSCKQWLLRMIGASDGFDLSSPNWEIWITIYGLLSQLFMRGIREKVKRGMKGEAERRTSLGRPPMGFTRKVIQSADGTVVHCEPASNGCQPNRLTQMALACARWTQPQDVSFLPDEVTCRQVVDPVPIESVPKYEQLAPKFRELHDKGASIQTIAAAHGLCWDQVKMILWFAATGERPSWPKKKNSGCNETNREKFISYSAEVVSRRSNGESFAKIALELGIGESTVRPAWDHANPCCARKALESGMTPVRGAYRHLKPEQLREVHSCLAEGKLSIPEIAARTGVSQSTIRREKCRLRKL